jgi:hypothetical protein
MRPPVVLLPPPRTPPNASSVTEIRHNHRAPPPPRTSTTNPRLRLQTTQEFNSESETASYDTTKEHLISPTRFFLSPTEYHRHPRHTFPTLLPTRHSLFYRSNTDEFESGKESDSNDRHTVPRPTSSEQGTPGSTEEGDDASTSTEQGDTDDFNDGQNPPSGTDDNKVTTRKQNSRARPRHTSTTIKIATYNIRDARNTRLQQACLDLEHQHIDVTILTKMRIPSSAPIHTRQCA